MAKTEHDSDNIYSVAKTEHVESVKEVLQTDYVKYQISNDLLELPSTNTDQSEEWLTVIIWFSTQSWKQWHMYY